MIENRVELFVNHDFPQEPVLRVVTGSHTDSVLNQIVSKTLQTELGHMVPNLAVGEGVYSGVWLERPFSRRDAYSSIRHIIDRVVVLLTGETRVDSAVSVHLFAVIEFAQKRHSTFRI